MNKELRWALANMVIGYMFCILSFFSLIYFIDKYAQHLVAFLLITGITCFFIGFIGFIIYPFNMKFEQMEKELEI